MAPSTRKAAPSSTATTTTTTRGSGEPTKSQIRTHAQLQRKAALNGGSHSEFGRVTKTRSGKGNGLLKVLERKRGAVERWCAEEEECSRSEGESEKENVNSGVLCAQSVDVDVSSSRSVKKAVAKRKRGDVSDCESESESEDVEEEKCQVQSVRVREQSKKRRVQLLSPPISREGTDCDDDSSRLSRLVLSPRSRRVNASLQSVVELPLALVNLISLHAAFLKALSLHYAHNGASSPAEVNGLMQSMTRLWKKQSVQLESIRRMLGLYEAVSDSKLFASTQVDQRRSPFKIITSGFGSNVRTNVEYVNQSPYNDGSLQGAFSDMVHSCFGSNPDIENMTNIPLLAISLGTQTSLYREKAASTRAEILGLSAAAQSRSNLDFSKLSITDPAEHTPAAIKSRTLSLFDRVRAKGLASMNSAAPTPEQITRRHAIGRIGEVVEFLRMKQQQKLSAHSYSSMHDSTDRPRGASKVSFSLGAIVNDIRQSVGVPIAEEEVKICLRILSQEIPGDWCQMIALGSIVSVTLQGCGMSGIEVRKFLKS